MKYFSTFTGIGGFELGIQQAYENTNSWGNRKKRPYEQMDLQRPRNKSNFNGGRKSEQSDQYTPRDTENICVGYSEIDRYAVQIYQKHFDHKNYGNIRDIPADALPDFDLLCGGFPCQAFSIAGKRGGFDDTRGTLFFELARIARTKRPRLLFFENVKGLLSHDGGRTFDTIIRTIDELGYDCQWQVLNSKNFGVPQNRERVFIIGHLRGTPRPEVFPFREDSQADIVLPTLTTRYYGGQANGGYIGDKSQSIRQLNQPTHSNNRLYGNDGIALALNTAQGGNRQPKITVIGNTQKHTALMEDESPTLTSGMGMGGGNVPMVTAVPLKFLDRNQKNYQGEYSFTLDSAQTGGVMQDMKIRRLTPTECARLQGFPDNWHEGVSDSQAYKCYGNAVTVNVIQAIAEKLFTA